MQGQFARYWSLFQRNPKEVGGYLYQIVQYLAWNGLTIDIPKSLNSLIRYHEKNITAATITNFFQDFTQTDYQTGVTNLQNNVANASEHMIIGYVRTHEAVNATLNASAWVPGFVTAAILNGRFNLTINNTIVLKDFPNTAFTQATANPFSGYTELDYPSVWPGQTALTLAVQTFTAPAANSNYRYELIGMGALA